MMRFHPVLALALVTMAGIPAGAQDHRPLTVAAGVTSFREQPPGDVFPAETYDTGWAVAVSCTFLWTRLGPVFDFGATSKRNIVDEAQKLTYYLAGARYDVLRSRWLTVFAQGLFGRETFTEPGFTDTGFAIQPGVGVDVLVWKGIGARGQVDYRLVHYGGDQGRFRDWRVFVGGVVAIGW